MPCVQFIVNGQVQGVGFRPFVYRLALECGLGGHVRNTAEGVEILLHGEQQVLDQFETDFSRNLPPLAEITAIRKQTLIDRAVPQTFAIKDSTAGVNHQVLISPDTATCPDCLKEIDAPGDRRRGYAFTNCTDCGPRFTITRSIPYDRVQTSMACFPMCPLCQKEYDNPLNRRFHAQPNACPVCGPELWYTTSFGKRLEAKQGCLFQAALDLHQGCIVAIKGLGGFHLACRAGDEQSIASLRQRKRRKDKPLAVMVPDLDAAKTIADISGPETACLCSRQRPIVLSKKKDKAMLPEALAPDTDRIGIMLPYTPLHHLLLKAYSGLTENTITPALVMTSGNISAKPLALGNREALDLLREVADRFLLHNRDILIRCDDSVLGVSPKSARTVFFRRARGYVPAPIFFKATGSSVLGLGAEKKSSVCLTLGNRAYVSQHLGDLTNSAVFDYFRHTIRHLQTILKIQPQALIADLHPDFLSTQYADTRPDLPVLQVQHHFAHLYAVLGENQVEEPLLGLILDGSGLGTDQTLWGGELLCLDPVRGEQIRLGHFVPVPLPGGDAAVLEPWKTALGYLHALKHSGAGLRPWPWAENKAKAAATVRAMLDKDLNCPITSSCGRLFDAVSALLGLSLHISYEGQAAIRLEKIQDRSARGSYPCPLISRKTGCLLDTLTLFRSVLEDWEKGVSPVLISRRFHTGLTQGLCRWAQTAAQRTGIRKIGLSGGVLQNLTLADELPMALEKVGLEVVFHNFLPPNDGCIAFGQAVFGHYSLRNSKS